jgi:hypothetical protein
MIVEKWVIAAMCFYETAAIVTGKVPTISKLSAKHHWISPVLVIALTAHLYRYDKKER